MVHTERGDISAAQRDLAQSIAAPVYGLALGPDAEECTSVAELAAAYCSAIVEIVGGANGPFLLCGSSVVGCVIAHACEHPHAVFWRGLQHLL